MIAAANILMVLFLSCAALIGLGLLHAVLTRQDRWNPINRRFIFGVRLTMLLFAGRALAIVTGMEEFRFFVLLAAGLIPLAVFLLTEGLLRRHAPAWMKGVMAGGATLFGITAFWWSDSIDPYRLIGLLAFQVIGFVLSGWLVLFRDRASLSQAENRMVGRLGVSLLFFIPVSLADFLILYFDLPLQFSALAVLFLCWLAVGLARSSDGHRATLLNFAIMTGAAIAVGLFLGILGGLGRDGTLMAIAAIMATVFLIVIYADARSLRVEQNSIGLLRHLAKADTTDPMVFLRDLRAHPLVDGAVMVDGAALADFDQAVLAHIFNAAPVLRAAEPPVLNAAAEDHIKHLFDRYAATHIILVDDAPFVLIALAIPSLGLSPQVELELDVVQRMAALMAKTKEA